MYIFSTCNVLECRLPEVRWDNQNIVVLDQVTIVPPYRVDDCTASDPNSQALQHVRKLVSITMVYLKKTGPLLHLFIWQMQH